MVVNKEDVIDFFDEVIEEILNKIVVWLLEGLGWVIELIIEYWVNIVSYIFLKGNFYIFLLEELKNFRKGLINIKNYDD